MAIDAKTIRPTLPEGYDPYDMTIKVQFNPKADAMNFIHIARKLPLLACGAAAKSKGVPCTMSAGFGTSHKGYGRCKFHGGCSTGPKTAEGKANVGRTRIHGLYAQVLSPQEQTIFESLNNGERKVADLELEIAMLKTKILVYLESWRNKYSDKLASRGEAAAENATKVYFSQGLDGSSRNYYHAGTIEDNALDRALNTLGRLVEKHDRLNGGNGGDLTDKINQELRSASFGQVSVAWGKRPAQTREDG